MKRLTKLTNEVEELKQKDKQRCLDKPLTIHKPLTKKIQPKKTDVGIVTEVILDETNESLPKFKTVGEGIFPKLPYAKVGGVKVRLLSNQEVNDDDLKIVYPLDDTLKTLPLLGEEVQVHTISYQKFYSRLLVDGTLNIQNTGNDKYKDQFGEGENVQDWWWWIFIKPIK